MNTLPKRKMLHHEAPPWVKPGEIYFITICCSARGRNQLAHDNVFQVMAEALEYYNQSGRWWSQLFLAMPDHLHGLFSFPANREMKAVVRDWKRFVAKAAGVEWQDGFFDHRLRNARSLQEKDAYIRMNPVRAGLVTVPELWPYVWSLNATEAAG